MDFFYIIKFFSNFIKYFVYIKKEELKVLKLFIIEYLNIKKLKMKYKKYK